MRNHKYMVKKSTVLLCVIAVAAIAVLYVWQFFLPSAHSGDMPIWEDYYNSGTALYNAGSYQPAATAFKIAIEIDSSRSEAYIGAAKAYIGLEDVERAKAILEKGYEETLSEDIRLALEELAQLLTSSETPSDGGTE